MRTTKATDIRALTVGPAWAYAIVVGAKKIENRSWNTNYRGPLLIHAGGSSSRQDEQEVDELLIYGGLKGGLPKEIDGSAFVGLAILADVVNDANPGKWKKDPWWCGPYGFVLKFAFAFAMAYPAKGKLGLWRPSSVDLRRLSKELKPLGL
jgi:hypothetical protein